MTRQVYAMSTGSERHVYAIVHEDARACSCNCFNTSLNEPRQRPRLEIALAHLNQIDAGGRSRAYAAHQRLLERRRGYETMPVGHQA